MNRSWLAVRIFQIRFLRLRFLIVQRSLALVRQPGELDRYLLKERVSNVQ